MPPLYSFLQLTEILNRYYKFITSFVFLNQSRTRNKFVLLYSDNQKTLKYEDDFIAILRCIWCCNKAISCTWHLLNPNRVKRVCLHCTNLMQIGLFKVKNWSKSRLPIPEFSGYHCIGRKPFGNPMNRSPVFKTFSKKTLNSHFLWVSLRQFLP